MAAWGGGLERVLVPALKVYKHVSGGQCLLEHLDPLTMDYAAYQGLCCIPKAHACQVHMPDNAHACQVHIPDNAHGCQVHMPDNAHACQVHTSGRTSRDAANCYEPPRSGP
eukprot:1160971-Pelagomonas_calceolata.AAC.5